jgi:hypothetical protein
LGEPQHRRRYSPAVSRLPRDAPWRPAAAGPLGREQSRDEGASAGPTTAMRGIRETARAKRPARPAQTTRAILSSKVATVRARLALRISRDADFCERRSKSQRDRPLAGERLARQKAAADQPANVTRKLARGCSPTADFLSFPCRSGRRLRHRPSSGFNSFGGPLFGLVTEHHPSEVLEYLGRCHQRIGHKRIRSERRPHVFQRLGPSF